MLFLLLSILVVAGLVGSFLSRRGISPWWTLVLAAGVAAIALTKRADVAECGSRDSAEALFGYGALVAVALFAATAFAAFLDAVSLARRGESALAAGRVLLLLLGLVLGFGTFALWFFTVLSCLS
jgi:hypothetical protein